MKKVQTFLGLRFFSELEKKQSQRNVGTEFFVTTFPPISGTLFLSELKCSDSSLRHFLLCTGARVLVIAS